MNILILLIFILIVFLILKKRESFTDTLITQYINSIESIPNQETKQNTINNYLRALKLNDSTEPVLYDIYLDERSSAMFNAKQKSSTKVPTFPKVLLPNVGCKNNAETCENSELELKEPSEIELKFINKPFNSLVSNDNLNYCNKQVVNCYNPVNKDGPFCVYATE